MNSLIKMTTAAFCLSLSLPLLAETASTGDQTAATPAPTGAAPMMQERPEDMPMMQGRQGSMPMMMQGRQGNMPMMQGQQGGMPMMMQGRQGNMPMMQGRQGGMPMMMQGRQGNMPMMQGRQGGMPMMMQGRQGNMPMMQGQQGNMPMMQGHQGMMGNHQPCNMSSEMKQQMVTEKKKHMQAMEQHLANIEALLRELVELQKK